MRTYPYLAAALGLLLAAAGADTGAQSRPTALERLAEAVDTIKRDYVDPVDDAKLAGGCRDGMLGAVDAAKRPQIAQAVSTRPASINDQFLALREGIAKHDPGAGDEAKLLGACLEGALKALDRISAYMDAREFRELQVGTQGEFGAIGLELRIEDGYPVVVEAIENTPAERAGLGAGDIVTEIDGASTRDQTLPDVVKRLRGRVGTSVMLTITRQPGGEPLTYSLTRGIIRVETVRPKTLAPGYGYIRVTAFHEATGPALARAIELLYKDNDGQVKGLILDLRNNPGGLLNACVAVAAVFLPRGALITYTEGRTEHAKMRLTASPENYLRGRTEDYVAALPAAVKTVPMAVLVNPGSASGSEMVATALQAHKRARILGTRTFDLGTIATILPLAGNTALKLTTARMFGPHGRPAAPVNPDVALEKSDLPAPKYGSADDGYLARALKLLGGPALDRR